MTTFSPYAGAGLTTLTDALLAPSSGITITSGTIALNASGSDAVNFYDGSLAPLGIGAGLLLTSGTTPGTANTVGWFGQDNSGTSGFNNGDANIDAVVNTVFQTQSYDATTLSFDFTVADPTAASVSFDLVFGSDEFPEWVDQFVDCAIVMVNGVNYALFNHDPMHPLSVVSSNLAAGYFQDNAGNVLPIEYDGVSHVLKIVAPIIPGATNHIEIGIADTGDHIYDSGIFLANFAAGNIPGSGVVSPTVTCTDGSDSVTGSAKDEYFDLKGGDDIVYAGAGDDIVVAGSGNDAVYGGSGADQMKGDAGNDSLDGGDDSLVGGDTAVYAGLSTDYSVAYDAGSGSFTITDLTGPATEGIDTLKNVEFAKFSDGLFALSASGLTLVVDPGPPPANTPGLVFVSGIGAPGQTLTAKVSDANGAPASALITYAWQADGVDLGVSGDTFLVGDAQVGQNISVTASYTDLAANAEFLTSVSKAIAAPGDGDFTITLLNLSAPIGASVMNPLTTLLQNAIDLGVSPIEASVIIKSALGFSGSLANVDLQHFDSWQALQANPGDATALAVEKKAVQVAVMTSLGGDDTGMTLTQAILLAHSTNTILDLTDEGVIANLLGLSPPNPALVHEIWDRNANIGDATSVAAINTEWLDMQSGLAVNISNSIGDLSIHVNQDPTGSATASLVSGLENTDYVIAASYLLQGFSDADGDALSVAALSADNGSVVDNLDGTFTITPASFFTGPVELTYMVVDGQGGSAPASQLFVINAATGVAIVGTAGADTIDAATTVAGQPLPTAHDDTISGRGGNDTISALAGDDVINGGAGADTMNGGIGDDRYVVDNASDVVTEAVGEGTDRVVTSVDYTLQTGTEVETLRANVATGLTLTGNEFSHHIIGGVGADTLNGGIGNDILNGSVGADVMAGGVGDDRYVVDNVSDVVTEAVGEGADRVLASIDYTLQAGTEVEYLLARADTGLSLAGNEFANKIFGGIGDDTLTGGGGRDILTGGSGADTFKFLTVSDTGAGGGTRDLIADFAAGDHIDLSAIDAKSGTPADDAFTLIGTGFTHHAGELRAYAAGVNTIVAGDVDGNGAADFQILLAGSHALGLGDFIL